MIHQENYLTYLPHSGFHNQRIALENAVFLAWFLNRTLIIPPLLMYKSRALIPIGRSFEDLYNRLSKHTVCKNNSLENCQAESYIRYNWEELMDFTFLKQNIKYIYRQDFNFNHLIESLYINNDAEIYNISNSREQQYCDYNTSKFQKCVNLVELRRRSEKLLHFGSVFSSHKIIATLPENRNFKTKLKQMMLPNNPTILSIANKIVDKIGGTNSFIGVHARLGDSIFLKHQNMTVQNLIETIQNDFKDIDIKDGSACLPTKIFLATDKRDSESLRLFFQTFPCVHMLNDFDDLLEPLKSLKNPSDGTIMYEFLIPFVDLLVVSRGYKFYKTSSSTFSRYAGFLNRLWLDNLE
ncbi:17874_t:CDS:1 [Dentiscutata erythropus]|uniref:17874_t:CDS:1 n=1 Tax=Dentiscutata erythropus TaxID=1348616 RepID=A0A9N9IIU8_9GLOM|nr:17874_t:CDS:1 [Dentiscutata erythropus]